MYISLNNLFMGIIFVLLICILVLGIIFLLKLNKTISNVLEILENKVLIKKVIHSYTYKKRV